jgi:hypothetical protein
MLLNLGMIEGQLYSIIARLQCQQIGNHNNVNPNLISDGIRAMTIDEVLVDFNKVTSILTKQVYPFLLLSIFLLFLGFFFLSFVDSSCSICFRNLCSTIN